MHFSGFNRLPPCPLYTLRHLVQSYSSIWQTRLAFRQALSLFYSLAEQFTEYLNNVKDASEDRRRLLNEVTSISGLLYFLKDRAAQSQQGDS
jgi:hypothetical protein